MQTTVAAKTAEIVAANEITGNEAVTVVSVPLGEMLGVAVVFVGVVGGVVSGVVVTGVVVTGVVFIQLATNESKGRC